jgi:hypothetical protein
MRKITFSGIENFKKEENRLKPVDAEEIGGNFKFVLTVKSTKDLKILISLNQILPFCGVKFHLHSALLILIILKSLKILSK